MQLFTQEQLRADQQTFLKKLQAVTEPYSVMINEITITVDPGVFPPTTDTKLLARHIQVKPGDRVLDLTCGSGVYSVISGLQGASGVSSDINPRAVQNTQTNIANYKLKFDAIESDLFESIPPEQFDHIFVNGPYIEGDVHDPLEYAFFGARSYIKRLIANAPSYLKSTGKILITFAEFGNIPFFESTVDASGFTKKLIERRVNSRGVLAYRLYEFSLK